MAEYIRLKVDYEGKPAGTLVERDETTEHLVTAGLAGPTVRKTIVVFREQWESPDGRIYAPGDYENLDNATADALRAQGIVEDPAR